MKIKFKKSFKLTISGKNFPTFIWLSRRARWIAINILYYIFLAGHKLKKRLIRLAKKIRHKATPKNLAILAAVVIIAGIFYYALQKYIYWRSEQYTYIAQVQIYNVRMEDPVEDARASFKVGDVMAIYPKGHHWADAEIRGYLLLKLKIIPEEAAKLMKSDTKEVAPSRQEITRLRSYHVKMNKLKFNPDDIWKGQTFDRKVFTMNIIEKK
jgi:hypothetical protein